ncbi:zinc-finger homeodomain protein 2-like [Senna tora]|uniref:Zinc-finger homeodomain protein 2-like n=1 Tax=Senna tora TaxID=362788 RepID=A0A834WSJ4_9FABA|nr:zinc-finger homeodomain protein 2-like [Senna tora]
MWHDLVDKIRHWEKAEGTAPSAHITWKWVSEEGIEGKSIRSDLPPSEAESKFQLKHKQFESKLLKEKKKTKKKVEADMEFEEQEEEDMGMPASPPGYDSLNNSGTRSKIGVSVVGSEGGASTVTAGRKVGSTVTARYRECQKNHAVSLGAHALDGCGEFIAAGEEGTLDGLKCAACNCHRNFHRKETEGGEMISYHPPYHHQQFPPYYRAPPPLPPPAGYLHHHHHLAAQPMAQQRPLALPPAAWGGTSSRDEEDISNPSSSGGGGDGGRKKRHRTKFTQEQKEKMLAFAERVGWRIQKHDEAAVEEFCAETGVRRHVLKVWMHNNKNTLGKKP